MVVELVANDRFPFLPTIPYQPRNHFPLKNACVPGVAAPSMQGVGEHFFLLPSGKKIECREVSCYLLRYTLRLYGTVRTDDSLQRPFRLTRGRWDFRPFVRPAASRVLPACVCVCVCVFGISFLCFFFCLFSVPCVKCASEVNMWAAPPCISNFRVQQISLIVLFEFEAAACKGNGNRNKKKNSINKYGEVTFTTNSCHLLLEVMGKWTVVVCN